MKASKIPSWIFSLLVVVLILFHTESHDVKEPGVSKHLAILFLDELPVHHSGTRDSHTHRWSIHLTSVLLGRERKQENPEEPALTQRGTFHTERLQKSNHCNIVHPVLVTSKKIFFFFKLEDKNRSPCIFLLIQSQTSGFISASTAPRIVRGSGCKTCTMFPLPLRAVCLKCASTCQVHVREGQKQVEALMEAFLSPCPPSPPPTLHPPRGRGGKAPVSHVAESSFKCS